MKSKAKDIEKKYPMLMVGNTKTIYLMINRTRGTVVVLGDGTTHKLGEICSDLEPSCLSPFSGKVVLKN